MGLTERIVQLETENDRLRAEAMEGFDLREKLRDSRDEWKAHVWNERERALIASSTMAWAEKVVSLKEDLAISERRRLDLEEHVNKLVLLRGELNRANDCADDWLNRAAEAGRAAAESSVRAAQFEERAFSAEREVRHARYEKDRSARAYEHAARERNFYRDRLEAFSCALANVNLSKMRSIKIVVETDNSIRFIDPETERDEAIARAGKAESAAMKAQAEAEAERKAHCETKAAFAAACEISDKRGERRDKAQADADAATKRAEKAEAEVARLAASIRTFKDKDVPEIAKACDEALVEVSVGVLKEAANIAREAKEPTFSFITSSSDGFNRAKEDIAKELEIHAATLKNEIGKDHDFFNLKAA